MKQITISLLTLFASISSLVAQNGTVSGKIQTSDARNIAEAKIFLVGGKDTAKSDMDGKYSISLPGGKYLIFFEHDNFGNYSDSIQIKAGEETFLNVVIDNFKKTKDIVISASRKPKTNTVEWAVQAKKVSQGMVDAISSEEFKKTTVTTSGDVIKRMPGVTIMEGKFANIRGMYDRYNAGYLNGAPLPSTESDRKAFSFDIIPANLLDNIVIIKSGTPDMIGDFGGGIIRINTKSIPDKLTQSFNLGFQYNSITTFKSVQEFPSYGSEYFGIPSPKRNLPNLDGALLGNRPAEVLVAESKKFNNDWTLKNTTPMLTPRLSYSIGMPFKFKHGRELGVLISVNYSLTQKYSDGLVNRFDLGDNRTASSFSDKLYTSNTQNGGIANLSYKINNRSRIDWRNLYTLNYGTSSTLRNGIANADDGVYSEGYSNLINSNRLASTQLNGTHLLGKNQTTLTWLVNYGNTSRQIPDFRIAQYAVIDGERSLSLNDFFNNGSGRFFSKMNENTLSSSVDMMHNFKFKTLPKLLTNFKYGVFRQQRMRTFTSRNFVYGPIKYVVSKNLPEQDFGANALSSSNLYLIEKTSSDKDEYTGTSNLNAAYAMIENNYPLFSSNGKMQNLRVIYGARLESFSQKLNNAYFDKFLKRDLANTGVTNDLLPSINLVIPTTGKTNVRMAYYKTVNRPEMREMAPFAFYNFNLNSEILGNTKLSRAILHNFDIRYEIFPGREDLFSIGGFAKRIINPIEFSLDVTQPAIRTFNYQNEKAADIYGLELELRKNLGFISPSIWNGFFRNLSLYGNFSLIRSQIKFRNESSSTVNRPLQGQSPYVANISLFYESKQGVQFNASFNKIGPRIAYIGVAKNVQPFGMDIYEYGRSIIDIQVGKNFKKIGNFKLTMGDLLHQNTIFYQDLNNNKKYDLKGDNTLFRFTNGSTVTMSYTYNF